MAARDFPLGEGMEATLDGDKLTIVVDLKNNAGTTSGGNKMIAKANGPIPGLGNVKCGINIYQVKPKG